MCLQLRLLLQKNENNLHLLKKNPPVASSMPHKAYVGPARERPRFSQSRPYESLSRRLAKGSWDSTAPQAWGFEFREGGRVLGRREGWAGCLGSGLSRVTQT